MKSLFKALRGTKAFRDLDDKEFSWVLYDVGNSAYTMLSCSLIPIWFKAMAKGHITDDQATAYYALAISLVTIIVALIGPICGVLADRNKKMLMFSTSVAAGCIGCILTGLLGGWMSFILVYIITKIAYQASLTFYDSMLGDVTTEERMDTVSSYGYAWGYIGSCIPFLVALVSYVLGPDMVGLISDFWSKFIGCTVTAVWWFLVTVPLFKNYKQIHYVDDSERSTVGKVFGKLFRTLRTIAVDDKKVLLFLIAFFLYIDGVGTIIDNCINIGTDLGIDTVGQVIFLLATQVVAWIGSLVFAKLAKKHSTGKLLLICIVGYFAACLYAFTLKTLWDFGILAFIVGCFQGSIQSLSRSYYSKIIPSDNSGEYFGIYDIFAKGASFLGSAVIAGVKLAGGTINTAVASLAIFFALGFLFLALAEKKPTLAEKQAENK